MAAVRKPSAILLKKTNADLVQDQTQLLAPSVYPHILWFWRRREPTENTYAANPVTFRMTDFQSDWLKTLGQEYDRAIQVHFWPSGTVSEKLALDIWHKKWPVTLKKRSRSLIFFQCNWVTPRYILVKFHGSTPKKMRVIIITSCLITYKKSYKEGFTQGQIVGSW